MAFSEYTISIGKNIYIQKTLNGTPPAFQNFLRSSRGRRRCEKKDDIGRHFLRKLHFVCTIVLSSRYVFKPASPAVPTGRVTCLVLSRIILLCSIFYFVTLGAVILDCAYFFLFFLNHFFNEYAFKYDIQKPVLFRSYQKD